MPELYSTIDTNKRDGSSYLQAGWQGVVWGRFRWEELEEEDVEARASSAGNDIDGGLLLQRYIPKVGANCKGQAEVEYPVFVPTADESNLLVSEVTHVHKAKKAGFEIGGLDWEALPILLHIIERLAETPVDEISSAKVAEGEGVPDVSSARRIE